MIRSEENRKKYNSYMKKYMNDLYQRKRIKIIEYLGGKCNECGSTNDLHVDHKDHTKKSFSLAKCWSYSWSILIEELKKCQLLCEECHLNKTKSEGSLAKTRTTKPRFIHGSYWTYHKHKCRCEKCIIGHQTHLQMRRDKHKNSKNDF
jgi:hypothetical protein